LDLRLYAWFCYIRLTTTLDPTIFLALYGRFGSKRSVLHLLFLTLTCIFISECEGISIESIKTKEKCNCYEIDKNHIFVLDETSK
jgi:hypothetical protein